MNRFRLDNPPLVYVLAQVLITPVLSMKEMIPAIQELLRKRGFPKFSENKVPQLSIQEGRLSPKESPIWCFFNQQQTLMFSVTDSSLVVQTTEYTESEPFLQSIRECLQAVSSVVGPELITTRRGLRYVNALRSKGDLSHLELVGPELLSLKLPSETFSDQNVSLETIAKTALGKVVLKYSNVDGQSPFPQGILPFDLRFPKSRLPMPGESFGLLDIDHFSESERDFTVDLILNELQEFNVVADSAFKTAVSSAAKKLWGYHDVE